LRLGGSLYWHVIGFFVGVREYYSLMAEESPILRYF